MTVALELAPQQQEAADKVDEWYHRSPRQLFRLFGFAGSGKSTVARYLVKRLGLRHTTYAAFTGKAAYVMRQKGCEDAGTIHSLIYTPVEKARARLARLREQLAELGETGNQAERATLLKAIDREQAKIDSPNWILKEESDLEESDLLVLDEVSMVGERMARDLMSFGTKILCLGDPAQLPPVDGAGWLINAPADHLLTEIHRSALDSPVTRMATAIRNSMPGQRDYGVSGRDGDSGRRFSLTRDELLAFDQVLVGKNATRWQAIRGLRAMRGLTGQRPIAGDRIIVLANNPGSGVFNGQQFEVLASADEGTSLYRLTVLDDEGGTQELVVWASGFADLDGEKEAKRSGRGAVVAATFAQAITTHKAQGSQYRRVLTVDESQVFYAAAYREAAATMGRGAAEIEGHVNARRWLYTAVTRASEQAVIVPGLLGLVKG